jgi:hypothetical protein
VAVRKRPTSRVEGVKRSSVPLVAQLDPKLTNWDYAFAYCRAADYVVLHALAEQSDDLLFLPVAFLARHALELALKAAIGELRPVAVRMRRTEARSSTPFEGGAIRRSANPTHSITELGAELERLWLERTDSDLPRSVVKAIRFVSRFDPTGQRMRYPMTRAKGKKRFRASFPREALLSPEGFVGSILIAIEILYRQCPSGMKRALDQEKILNQWASTASDPPTTHKDLHE